MLEFTTKDFNDSKFTDFNYRLNVYYNVDKKADRLAWHDFNEYRWNYYDVCAASELKHHFYNNGWTYYCGITLDFNKAAIRDNVIQKLHELNEKYQNVADKQHCVERAFIKCAYYERQYYIDKMQAWLNNHKGCSLGGLEEFEPDLIRPHINFERRRQLRGMCQGYICLPVRLFDKSRHVMFKLSWQTKLGISDLEVNDAVA